MREMVCGGGNLGYDISFQSFPCGILARDERIRHTSISHVQLFLQLGWVAPELPGKKSPGAALPPRPTSVMQPKQGQSTFES